MNVKTDVKLYSMALLKLQKPCPGTVLRKHKTDNFKEPQISYAFEILKSVNVIHWMWRMYVTYVKLCSQNSVYHLQIYTHDVNEKKKINLQPKKISDNFEISIIIVVNYYLTFNTIICLSVKQKQYFFFLVILFCTMKM